MRLPFAREIAARMNKLPLLLVVSRASALAGRDEYLAAEQMTGWRRRRNDLKSQGCVRAQPIKSSAAKNQS